ncbi:MAG: hypothetical protein WCQ21_31505 [Verrucomicrobiota bacterium]
MKTSHSPLIITFTITSLICLSAQAQWVRWDTASGGNGHWYKAVPNTGGVTPQLATQLARQDGGYLASITSAEENSFVFGLVNSPAFFNSFNGSGPVLGGRQQPGASEPAGGWYWLSGEPWNYTNWSSDSPDNGGGVEDSLEFYSGMGGTPAPTWNDQPFDDPNCGGYVVERSDDPRPPGFDVTELVLVGIASLTNQGFVHLVAASGTRALVTTGERSVHLVDFSMPTNPTLLGTWHAPCQVADAELVGNMAYVASYEFDFLSTVEIIDFSDPAKPVLKGYYDTVGYAEDLEVVGSTVYVADGETGLLILDVSDLASPRKLASYVTKGSVQRVDVAGPYAFVADGDWLLILEVSSPAAPVRVGGYEVTGGIQTLKVINSTAYILENGVGLRVLNVADPRKVERLGTYHTWGTQTMTVAGKYAYLARGGYGLEVADVNSPTNLVWATGATTGGSAQDVAVMGKYVLVAAGDGGLKVFEVQQTPWPSLKASAFSAGMLTLSWPPLEGIRLQKSVSLAAPDWHDVLGTENTNSVTLPIGSGSGFFRLVKP